MRTLMVFKALNFFRQIVLKVSLKSSKVEFKKKILGQSAVSSFSSSVKLFCVRNVQFQYFSILRSCSYFTLFFFHPHTTRSEQANRRERERERFQCSTGRHQHGQVFQLDHNQPNGCVYTGFDEKRALVLVSATFTHRSISLAQFSCNLHTVSVAPHFC